MDLSGPLPIMTGGDPVAAMTEYSTKMAAALAGTWTPIVFTSQSGWVAFGGNYATPAWRIVGDTVELRGLVKGGTFGSLAFATLPTAARPSAAAMIATIGAVGSARAMYGIDIFADGRLVCAGTGTAAFLSLDGVRFPRT